MRQNETMLTVMRAALRATLLSLAAVFAYAAEILRICAKPLSESPSARILKNDLPNGHDDKLSAVPRHISFIMDGNRRHARAHGRPESDYRPGLESFKRVCKWCAEQPGIERASFFALSTENCQKRTSEQLIVEAERDLISVAHELGATIRMVSSDVMLLAPDTRAALKRVQDSTAVANPRLCIDILVAYGGRDDIVQACRSIMRSDQKQNADALFTEEAISAALATSPATEPDLIVRTAEQRISNFTMWQSSYSELAFLPDLLWPDISERDLDSILEDYQRRKRRFGA